MPRFCRSILTGLLAAMLVIIQAGCQPATPAPAPAVLRMNYTPALRPFGPVFQTCTHMQPGLSLLVNELALSQVNTLPSDLILTWGQASIPDRTPYQTGIEELVFIVNSANPVSTISAQQLEAALSGQTSTWGALLQPACPDCAAESPDRPLSDSTIEIWSYPAGSENQAALAGIPGGSQIPPFQSRLAPDAEAMRQAVAGSYTALGFIPRRWLDDSVKLLTINGLPDGSARQPILAYPAQPLTPASSAFIACLQQVLNP